MLQTFYFHVLHLLPQDHNLTGGLLHCSCVGVCVGVCVCACVRIGMNQPSCIPSTKLSLSHVRNASATTVSLYNVLL